jgi:hypothetical protein
MILLMETCKLTLVVIILGAVMIVFDTYVFGGGLNLIASAFYVVIVAIITNYACYSKNYRWIAWILLVIQIFTIIVMVYMISTMSKDEIKIALG